MTAAIAPDARPVARRMRLPAGVTSVTPGPIAAVPIGPISEPISPYVVVVDDSSDMRDLIRDILVGAGFDVATAASGPRALEVMQERLPDLLITDLLMPGMSGFSLRAVMLRRPELAKVPVVVLSAYWHRPGETLDVHDVLTKPLNVDRLIETARRLTRTSDGANPVGFSPGDR